jgi:hypothetical protein
VEGKMKRQNWKKIKIFFEIEVPDSYKISDARLNVIDNNHLTDEEEKSVRVEEAE